MTFILGIETSCDETGIAIYSEQGVLANKLYTQIELHAKFGGVVPELASRDHLSKIFPLLQEALQEAKITLQDISAIAYTAGPGLVGALLVGATVGRSLSYALNIPAIAVNHMEAHLLAPLIEDHKPNLPFLALLVSGGHTQIFQVNKIGDYTLLGESIDDAAGEAFDKTAKLLGLNYPGGPKIAKLAETALDKYHFDIPMKQGLNFSFSGLKTATANLIHKEELTDENKKSIAKAFQETVVNTLLYKCKKALQETNINHLVVAGGVSANTLLRTSLQDMLQKMHGEVFYPKLEYCTDNGAMIAHAGFILYQQHRFKEDLAIDVHPRWEM